MASPVLGNHYIKVKGKAKSENVFRETMFDDLLAKFGWMQRKESNCDIF